jgi:hypothetical protein
MCYTQNRFNALLSACVLSLIATTSIFNWANIDCACESPNWADGVHLVLGGTEADLEGMTVRDWLDLARIGLPSGDASFDGCVDDADLIAVLFVFGQTGDLPEDVNDDGVVDDADLLIVLFNFGSGC